MARTREHHCTGVILFIAGLILFVIGIMEIHKSNTYIKNYCQVIGSDTAKDDCADTGKRCKYRAEWAVLYDRPNDNDEPIEAVINSHLETESEEKAATKQMEYQVDKIYTCYHSPREAIVQWEGPSKSTGVILLVVGSCLLVVGCTFCILWCKRQFCQRELDTQTTEEINEANNPFNPTINT